MRKPKLPQGWPHQFSNDGSSKPGEAWGTTWQPKICIHCDLKYTLGRDPIPGGFCPARGDKSELERLYG